MFFGVDRSPSLLWVSYLATLLWRKGDEDYFSQKLCVRIKDNKNSPHGKFHRFLCPFSSKFSDLNFASYVLYNLPVLRHVSHTVSPGYLWSKLYKRARAMKQDGQPINLLPRYVHSRQKPLVGQQQQQQQLPTTRKEDFHCQFAGCIKICKSAGGLTLHVRKMHRVQNNWRSIKASPHPYFWSKGILLATISCYNWLLMFVYQSRSFVRWL